VTTHEPIGTDIEPKVFDAELVEENGTALTPVSRIVAAVRSDRSVKVTRAAGHWIAQGGRAVGRVALTVAQGHASWGRRAVRAITYGHVRDQLRLAQLAGNQEAVAEWTDRLNALKDARADRMRELPATLSGGIKAALLAVIVLAGVLVVAGAGFQFSPGGMDWMEWWALLGDVAGILGVIFTAALHIVLWGGIPAFLVAAWREGKRRGGTIGWLATASEADMDATIDEATIGRALAALRIPQITAYLKEGMPLQYITPARVDGRGTHAMLRLPAGVTAEKIARRRADLATGLHRLAKEVWPTTGSEAGILDLWVADKGALAEGAGQYPLLDDGLVDVFKGVPFGKTLRGEPLTAPLMERNTITGGMPGQGKSSAARAIMAGAALDPTAELRIWVPEANFDFEAFKPRCSRYVMGAEDEKIEEILVHLRELHDEVQQRGELLIKYETPAVTRELANKNIGLHPLICLLEEAHVAIQHPIFGPEIAKLLVNIVRLGRKRGIHLILSTQAPTKDSMPRDVTRNCSNGVAFAVGDHVANDALLGQGAYTAGHRATELIPGTDRGTAVVKGFSGERSEIVQVYFLSITKENDHVTPIIDRALAAIAELGALPGIGRDAPQVEIARDLLSDLDTVLGNESVPAADVPALLSRLAPHWAPYKALTGKALRAELAELGVKVPSTGNRWPVDPVTIRDSLAQRESADR
jgi:DNA segregation ATPase FtsK/SpoIIIE, S-DNA-T family